MFKLVLGNKVVVLLLVFFMEGYLLVVVWEIDGSVYLVFEFDVVDKVRGVVVEVWEWCVGGDLVVLVCVLVLCWLLVCFFLVGGIELFCFVYRELLVHLMVTMTDVIGVVL